MANVIDKLRSKAAEEKEAASNFPPFYKMEPGEELVVEIVAARENNLDPEKAGQHIYDVREQGGEPFTLQTHDILIRELEKRDAKKGDWFYIKFEGLTKAKKSTRTYNSYQVYKLSPADVQEMMAVGAPKTKRNGK